MVDAGELMGQNIREKILTHIECRRQEIIGFLRELISFPSITGNEKEIQHFIAKRLEGLKLKVDMWEPDLEELKKHPAYVPVERGYENRPNVVSLYQGIGGGNSLLFNSHVDVIPVGPIELWKHGPWAGEIEGGRMYGRGASDTKSGVAAMTMALETLLQLGVKLKGDVILEYTVDEELSGHGTLACILRGYGADAGICCETSGLHIQPASIGRIWFDITVHGKSTGIQRKWEGVSSIDKGYKIVQAIEDLEQMKISEVSHPLYPNIKSAIPHIVGVFKAGTYPSAFPDRCLLKGSLGTVPGEDSQKVKERFREHILNVAKTDPWLKHKPPEIRFTGYFAEPSEIPVDHPICKAVINSFREVVVKEPEVSGRKGAADTRFLNTYGQTPTVIFGPGSTDQMHALNEWVNLEDLIVAVKILALTIIDWCGYEYP